MSSPVELAERTELAEQAIVSVPSGFLLPTYGLGIARWEESAGNAVPTRALANTIHWFALWTKRSTCFIVLRS
jgi:hypothetical protein